MIYRCIGDRYFDGLLDERVIAATNPDGSGNMAEITRLIESDPEIGTKLDRLRREPRTPPSSRPKPPSAGVSLDY